MLWSMLSAYQRTLRLTLAGAHSMGEVVEKKAVPWVTTPDQAMAWGVAFGLDHEIEVVLSRSLVADEEIPGAGVLARPIHTWYPAWYQTGSFSSGAAHVTGVPSGIFSASALPDPGSIMAGLKSVTSPSLPYTSSNSSSNSSGFSGGSFGGGGGGGGGGAGGGF
jgi:uncharacterized membrane protein YgcG